jgi:hypothetical protein
MSLWFNAHANAYSDCNTDSDSNINSDRHTYRVAQGHTDPENSTLAAPAPDSSTSPVASASARKTQYPIRRSKTGRWSCS